MLKTLMPNMMGFEDGVFRRYLGVDEVMRMKPHNGISALMRRDTRDTLPAHPPWEDTAKGAV